MHRLTTLTLAAMLLAVGLPSVASARFSHAGGFICGAGPGSTNARFVNGDYRSAFNVLNTSRTTLEVDLRLSLTFPPGDLFQPGAVFDLGSVTLAPGQAVMIDCAEFVDATGLELGGSPPYFAGMFEARARRRLAVTLLQSAGPQGGDVSSYAVTPIEALRVLR